MWQNENAEYEEYDEAIGKTFYSIKKAFVLILERTLFLMNYYFSESLSDSKLISVLYHNFNLIFSF